MRTKLKITEGIFPMPVLMVATYNEDGSVNVMNAAWGTMQERDTVALNLTESHKTVQNIKARGAFTVSIADAAHVVEADYFGVESGNRAADKFARSGLSASKAEMVDAPVINVGALDNHYSSVIQQLTQSRKKLEELRKSREKQISEIEYLERKLAESKSAKLIDSDADLDADIAVYQKYALVEFAQ